MARVTTPLHVLHVTASLSRLGGGVSEMIWLLAAHAQQGGFRATVVGTRDAHTDEDAARHPGITWFAGHRAGPPGLHFSPEVARHIARLPRDIDVVHAHGLWPLTGVTARRFADRRKLPRILSLHGMLEPWARGHRAWKKDLAGALYQNRNLRTASCLHATAAPEAKNLRAIGCRNPIAVVGIGVDLNIFSTTRADERVESKWPGLRGTKRLLYLSRFHPVKGPVHLARAWTRVHRRHPDWRLVLVGNDQEGHQAEVERVLADARGSFVFTGPAYAQMKSDLYSSCDVFVQPSLQENFGITIVEALASGRPVIATRGTPWQELVTERCGWWVQGGEPGEEELAAALEEAMSLSDHGRMEMSVRARALAESRYSWPAIAREMGRVYAWLAGKGPMPACVDPGA